MSFRAFVTVGLGAALICAASPALAQRGSWTPRTQGSRIGGEIGVWSMRDYDTFNFAFLAQIKVARVLYIDIEVPWTAVSYDPTYVSRDTDVLFGNPTVGLHYGANVTETIGLYAGGTISIPTALDPTLNEFGVGLAGTYAYAYGDMHRYLPEYVHLRPRGGVEIRMAPVVYYRGEIAPLLMIPAGRDVDSTEFVFETSHEFEGRAPIGVGGGVRLQAVFYTFDRRDNAQTAIEPFFAYEPPAGHFYAKVGFLLALDKDLGFGFDRRKVATLRASLGGKW